MERVTLARLCGGAVEERFLDEWRRVIENCLDPNTDHKAPRTITITIGVRPNEERTAIDLKAVCVGKVRPARVVQSYARIGVEPETGEVVAIEDTSRNQPLFRPSGEPAANVLPIGGVK